MNGIEESTAPTIRRWVVTIKPCGKHPWGQGCIRARRANDRGEVLCSADGLGHQTILIAADSGGRKGGVAGSVDVFHYFTLYQFRDKKSINPYLTATRIIKQYYCRIDRIVALCK